MNELPFRLRWIIALRESELTPMAKLCGFVVVSYMNDEGAAWPTLPTIAAGGSISRRAAVTAVNLLEAATFLQKESSRKGNRYYPRLTVETERLVAEFLDRARRRRGQLSIPLDARGLSVVGSAGGALHSAPDALHGAGGALRSAGGAPEVVSEVDSEVVNEISGGCSDTTTPTAPEKKEENLKPCHVCAKVSVGGVVDGVWLCPDHLLKAWGLAS